MPRCVRDLDQAGLVEVVVEAVRFGIDRDDLLARARSPRERLEVGCGLDALEVGHAMPRCSGPLSVSRNAPARGLQRGDGSRRTLADAQNRRKGSAVTLPMRWRDRVVPFIRTLFRISERLSSRPETPMDALTSLDKAIDLLEHLHDAALPRGDHRDRARARRAEVDARTGCSQALVRRGLVEHDAAGRYRPGPAAGRARPRRARARADRRAGAARARGGGRGDRRDASSSPRRAAARIVVLDKAEGAGFLRAAPRVGERRAARTRPPSAGSRWRSRPSASRSPRRARPRFTRAHAARADALRARVARARSDGFASNRGEWIDGLVVVAAPVLGAAGRPRR